MARPSPPGSALPGLTPASRWAWIISTVAALGAAVVLAFLLSIATNSPRLYERHYVWLFWVNVVVASLLVLVICIAAGRLLLRVSRSIESWFDLKVERALEAGLTLGKGTLDTLVSDLATKTRVAAERLGD